MKGRKKQNDSYFGEKDLSKSGEIAQGTGEMSYDEEGLRIEDWLGKMRKTKELPETAHRGL